MNKGDLISEVAKVVSTKNRLRKRLIVFFHQSLRH